MEGREFEKLLRAIGDEFGPTKPRHRALVAFVAQFGVAEAIALGSLLIQVWPYIFPKDGPKRCPYPGPLGNRVCGKPLQHTEFKEASQELIMVCTAGHATRQRTKRTYGP